MNIPKESLAKLIRDPRDVAAKYISVGDGFFATCKNLWFDFKSLIGAGTTFTLKDESKKVHVYIPKNYLYRKKLKNRQPKPQQA